MVHERKKCQKVIDPAVAGADFRLVGVGCQIVPALPQRAQDRIDLAPLPLGRDAGEHLPDVGDRGVVVAAVAAWRQRMGTEPAKEIYKRRASTAEWVNARARNMGLRQFLIRGLEKVRSVALLMALASNMLQAFARSKVAVAA